MTARKPPRKRRRAPPRKHWYSWVSLGTGSLAETLRSMAFIVTAVWAATTWSANWLEAKAEDFVNTTVQDRILTLEQQISELRLAIEEGRATDAEAQASLDALKLQLELLQQQAEQARADNQSILDSQQMILESIRGLSVAP